MMKLIQLIVISICCIFEYTSVDIILELERNRINFKYEGMLSHSFDRLYVVSGFILPTIDD